MQQVGDILRSEREKKGLTVKDIESATSIRALYIQAIEDGEFKVIPGEVYLKGFIRNYANYLGLNGQEMVDLYRQGQAPASVAPETVVEVKAATTPSPSADTEPKKGKSSYTWVVIPLVAVCLLGAVWWFIGGEGKPENQPLPDAPKQSQSAPAKPAPPPAPAAPVTPAAPAPQTAPVMVTAQFSDECWLTVIADGKEIFEGIPKAGESLSWQAQKTLVVKLGNAGGVDWVYNGQSVGKLGKKGEVVTKTFAAKQ